MSEFTHSFSLTPSSELNEWTNVGNEGYRGDLGYSPAVLGGPPEMGTTAVSNYVEITTLSNETVHNFKHILPIHMRWRFTTYAKKWNKLRAP